MHNFSIPKSFSATTTNTAASTNAITPESSQLETVAGQHPPGSFVGLSATVHMPEPTLISATYHQQYEPRLLSDARLLSDINASQVDPFEILATHQTVTFEDQNQVQEQEQEQPEEFPLPFDELLQPVDDIVPIVREEQIPDSTDKWIMMSGDEKRPYQCGYEGCGRTYIKKGPLKLHIIKHPSDLKFRCYFGDCSGAVRYRDTRALTRHIHTYHTLEKSFGCEICHRGFRCADSLKYHREHVHSKKSEKKSPKRHSITSGVSQPELAAGQRQQGTYVGVSTTIDTPESMQIPIDYQQQAELRPLAEVSALQIKIDPFEALAAHQTATFDDEAVTTGMAGVPNLTSDQYQAEQNPDPTDTNKWIIVDKSQKRLYKCGYPGCDKYYLRRPHLKRHFVKHTGRSKFKCLHPDCIGNEYFGDSALLRRHIATKHTLDKPFQCERCYKRFAREDSLKHHRKHTARCAFSRKGVGLGSVQQNSLK